MASRRRTRPSKPPRPPESPSSSSSPRTAGEGSNASASPPFRRISTRWTSSAPQERTSVSHPTPCAPARSGWLEEIGRYAEREGLVLHVHADEQPKEIAECLAEHGVRPIELLARTGCLGPRTTIVHGTHADDAELDLLAEAGARICVCPLTEANLGDGFLPVSRVREKGIPLCIGSDSNVRLDPFEELRELEGIARRQELRRNVIPVPELLGTGSAEGARALGLEEWPGIAIDRGHPSLAGVAGDEIEAALVFGCGGDVVVD